MAATPSLPYQFPCCWSPHIAPEGRPLQAFKAHDEILRLLETDERAVVITGATGSGKTTQVPKIIFRHRIHSHILIAQPRRYAVKKVAYRLALEIEGMERPGGIVGYHVGFSAPVKSIRTRIMVITYGLLRKYLCFEIQSKGHSVLYSAFISDNYDVEMYKYLNDWKWTHLILDEIHERDTDMEISMLLLKYFSAVGMKSERFIQNMAVDRTQGRKSAQKGQRQNSSSGGKVEPTTGGSFKVILMSATMAPDEFTHYFSKESLLKFEEEMRRSCENPDSTDSSEDAEDKAKAKNAELLPAVNSASPVCVAPVNEKKTSNLQFDEFDFMMNVQNDGSDSNDDFLMASPVEYQVSDLSSPSSSSVRACGSETSQEAIREVDKTGKIIKEAAITQKNARESEKTQKNSQSSSKTTSESNNARKIHSKSLQNPSSTREDEKERQMHQENAVGNSKVSHSSSDEVCVTGGAACRETITCISNNSNTSTGSITQRQEVLEVEEELHSTAAAVKPPTKLPPHSTPPDKHPHLCIASGSLFNTSVLYLDDIAKLFQSKRPFSLMRVVGGGSERKEANSVVCYPPPPPRTSFNDSICVDTNPSTAQRQRIVLLDDFSASNESLPTNIPGRSQEVEPEHTDSESSPSRSSLPKNAENPSFPAVASAFSAGNRANPPTFSNGGDSSSSQAVHHSGKGDFPVVDKDASSSLSNSMKTLVISGATMTLDLSVSAFSPSAFSSSSRSRGFRYTPSPQSFLENLLICRETSTKETPKELLPPYTTRRKQRHSSAMSSLISSYFNVGQPSIPKSHGVLDSMRICCDICLLLYELLTGFKKEEAIFKEQLLRGGGGRWEVGRGGCVPSSTSYGFGRQSFVEDGGLKGVHTGPGGLRVGEKNWSARGAGGRIAGGVEEGFNMDCILVFLPGKAEIFSMSNYLENFSNQFTIIHLHGQSREEVYRRVDEPPRAGTLKVILATNVAESSITLKGVLCVIDFGLIKRGEYKASHLATKYGLCWASKSACEQRKGRVGRYTDGLVFRLVPEEFYCTLSDFPSSSLKECALDQVVLELMLSFDGFLKKPSPFFLLRQCLAPPEDLTIENTMSLLLSYGAFPWELKLKRIDSLTGLGKFYALLPCEIRDSRIIFFSLLFGFLEEAVSLAAINSTWHGTLFEFSNIHVLPKAVASVGGKAEDQGSFHAKQRLLSMLKTTLDSREARKKWAKNTENDFVADLLAWKEFKSLFRRRKNVENRSGFNAVKGRDLNGDGLSLKDRSYRITSTYTSSSKLPRKQLFPEISSVRASEKMFSAYFDSSNPPSSASSNPQNPPDFCESQLQSDDVSAAASTGSVGEKKEDAHFFQKMKAGIERLLHNPMVRNSIPLSSIEAFEDEEVGSFKGKFTGSESQWCVKNSIQLGAVVQAEQKYDVLKQRLERMGVWYDEGGGKDLLETALGGEDGVICLDDSENCDNFESKENAENERWLLFSIVVSGALSPHLTFRGKFTSSAYNVSVRQLLSLQQEKLGSVMQRLAEAICWKKEVSKSLERDEEAGRVPHTHTRLKESFQSIPLNKHKKPQTEEQMMREMEDYPKKYAVSSSFSSSSSNGGLSTAFNPQVLKFPRSKATDSHLRQKNRGVEMEFGPETRPGSLGSSSHSSVKTRGSSSVYADVNKTDGENSVFQLKSGFSSASAVYGSSRGKLSAGAKDRELGVGAVAAEGGENTKEREEEDLFSLEQKTESSLASLALLRAYQGACFSQLLPQTLEENIANPPPFLPPPSTAKSTSSHDFTAVKQLPPPSSLHQRKASSQLDLLEAAETIDTIYRGFLLEQTHVACSDAALNTRWRMNPLEGVSHVPALLPPSYLYRGFSKKEKKLMEPAIFWVAEDTLGVCMCPLLHTHQSLLFAKSLKAWDSQNSLFHEAAGFEELKDCFAKRFVDPLSLSSLAGSKQASLLTVDDFEGVCRNLMINGYWHHSGDILYCTNKAAFEKLAMLSLWGIADLTMMGGKKAQSGVYVSGQLGLLSPTHDKYFISPTSVNFVGPSDVDETAQHRVISALQVSLHRNDSWLESSCVLPAHIGLYDLVSKLIFNPLVCVSSMNRPFFATSFSFDINTEALDGVFDEEDFDIINRMRHLMNEGASLLLSCRPNIESLRDLQTRLQKLLLHLLLKERESCAAILENMNYAHELRIASVLERAFAKISGWCKSHLMMFYPIHSLGEVEEDGGKCVRVCEQRVEDTIIKESFLSLSSPLENKKCVAHSFLGNTAYSASTSLVHSLPEETSQAFGEAIISSTGGSEFCSHMKPSLFAAEQSLYVGGSSSPEAIYSPSESITTSLASGSSSPPTTSLKATASSPPSTTPSPLIPPLPLKQGSSSFKLFRSWWSHSQSRRGNWEQKQEPDLLPSSVCVRRIEEAAGHAQGGLREALMWSKMKLHTSSVQEAIKTRSGCINFDEKRHKSLIKREDLRVQVRCSLDSLHEVCTISRVKALDVESLWSPKHTQNDFPPLPELYSGYEAQKSDFWRLCYLFGGGGGDEQGVSGQNISQEEVEAIRNFCTLQMWGFDCDERVHSRFTSLSGLQGGGFSPLLKVHNQDGHHPRPPPPPPPFPPYQAQSNNPQNNNSLIIARGRESHRSPSHYPPYHLPHHTNKRSPNRSSHPPFLYEVVQPKKPPGVWDSEYIEKLATRPPLRRLLVLDIDQVREEYLSLRKAPEDCSLPPIRTPRPPPTNFFPLTSPRNTHHTLNPPSITNFPPPPPVRTPLKQPPLHRILWWGG